jgi:hypothetical protein
MARRPESTFAVPAGMLTVVINGRSAIRYGCWALGMSKGSAREVSERFIEEIL